MERVWTSIKEGQLRISVTKTRLQSSYVLPQQNQEEKQNQSLAGYVGRMKPEQEKIFYVAAENYHTARNSPHLEIFNREGIEVLLLHDRIDEWLVGQLQEFDGKAFQDVARELDLGELGQGQDKNKKKKEQDEKNSPISCQR